MNCNCNDSHCECGSHCNSGCECEGNCNCKHCECDSSEEKFIKITHWACAEIMKDKIKARLLEQKNEQFEKIARLFADTHIKKMGHKFAAKAACNNLKNELDNFMSQF